MAHAETQATTEGEVVACPKLLCGLHDEPPVKDASLCIQT